MKRWIYAAAAAAMTAAWIPAAQAQDHKMGDKWAKNLGLTDKAQIEQLKTAMKARREAMKASREALRKDMEALRDETKVLKGQVGKAGEDAVQATLDKLAAIRQNMEKDRDAMREAMRAAEEKFKSDTAFLKPSQRAKLMLWHMKQMMHMRRHGKEEGQESPEPGSEG